MTPIQTEPGRVNLPSAKIRIPAPRQHECARPDPGPLPVAAVPRAGEQPPATRVGYGGCGGAASPVGLQAVHWLRRPGPPRGRRSSRSPGSCSNDRYPPPPLLQFLFWLCTFPSGLEEGSNWALLVWLVFCCGHLIPGFSLWNHREGGAGVERVRDVI